MPRRPEGLERKYRLTCAYLRAYKSDVFEWDKTKAWQNERKHGISFADTFGVFEDPNALTLEDFESDEERFVTVGMDGFGRVLVVVYTWRGDRIRIISARKSTRSEVREYESKI